LTEVAEEERRAAPRKILSVRAKVEMPGNKTLDGQTVDVSETGMSVVTPFELRPGQECTISLDLSACGVDSEIHIVGRACYCVKSGAETFRTGMQFVQLTAETQAFIAAMLR
jgi:hypothetical protein